MSKVYVTALVAIVLAPVFSIAQSRGELAPSMRYHSADKPFNPATAKIGDKACICPASGSYEHHVWVRDDDFYTGPVCVHNVQKTKDGWKIWIGEIKIAEIGSDREFKNLGYIRITEILP